MSIEYGLFSTSKVVTYFATGTHTGGAFTDISVPDAQVGDSVFVSCSAAGTYYSTSGTHYPLLIGVAQAGSVRVILSDMKDGSPLSVLNPMPVNILVVHVR